MKKLKGIKTVLGIVQIVLSVITICYCLATWRNDDEDDIIDAEIIQ